MLINTTKKLKSKLGGIQQKSHFDTWAPFVEAAEYGHIIPAIGEELYDELVALIDPLTDNLLTQEPKEVRLIEYVRQALAYYVEMESELSIMLLKGDGGTQVASSQNMQAPGKWMIVGRIRENRDKADRAIERVLQYLEEKADHFGTWTASAAHSRDGGLFIGSATEYTEYFGAVQNSRRLYNLLRPYLVKSEKDTVKPLTGAPFFFHLKEKLLIATTDWSAEEAEALEMIRAMVAHDAFSRAVTYLNINSEMRLLTETDGIVNEDALSDNRRSEIRASCNDEVNQKEAKLKHYLDETASATALEAYFHSSTYTPRLPKEYRLPNNSDPAKPFIL